MAWLDGRDAGGALLSAPGSDGVDVSGWTLLGLAWGVGGTQAYELHEEDYGGVKVKTWLPRGARDVELIDCATNESVGYHHQGDHGPIWSCTADGSWVQCQVLTKGPDYDDRINELRLGRTAFSGHAMGRVWEVQRLQTSGGKARDELRHNHHAGDYDYVPYTAMYAFWGEEP